MAIITIKVNKQGFRTIDIFGFKIKLDRQKRLFFNLEQKILSDLKLMFESQTKNVKLPQANLDHFMNEVEINNRMRLISSIVKDNIENYGELVLLSDKYGSDKGSVYRNVDKEKHNYPWLPHTYCEIYEILFNKIKFEVKNVFECGLGTNDTSIKSNMSAKGAPGASLRIWRDYFPKAQVYGADIDKKVLFEEERIKTFYLDQTNQEVIEQTFKNLDIKFDLMIDDGLHTAAAAICLFKNSFAWLNDNGIYIIEDMRIEDVFVVRDFLSGYENIKVSYLIMKTDKNIDNNLIVIQKEKK